MKSNSDERLEQICQRGLRLLKEKDLLCANGKEANFKSTEFGDTMSRYCIKFETMTVLLRLGEKPKMSEIVSNSYLSSEHSNLTTAVVRSFAGR